MIHPFEPIQFSVAALLCAAIASIHDVRERRIPNWLTGPAILLALVAHGLTGGRVALLSALLAGLLAGGVMLIFFLAGGMGAGDVKLMAATGCMVGLHPLGTLLFATALSGALLALLVAHRHHRLRQSVAAAWMLVEHHRSQGLRPHEELNLSSSAGLRMPYALPIAAGCLAVCGGQLWGS